jgi:hypothetical protein
MSDSPKEHPTHAPIELPEDEKVISQEEVHEDAARQLSEEQEKLVADMALPAELAQHLVMNVPEFGQLVASMLASRQLYAMCMYEMDMLCDRTDFKGMGIEEIDTAALEDFQVPMLKEILINSAAVQAQQPFDEKLLFNGFVKTVFPWMQNVVVDHTKQQEEASKKEFDEMNAKRIVTPLNLDVQWYPDSVTDTGTEIGRTKSVMLVGLEPAVRWVLDKITETALKDGSNVNQAVRLHSGGPPKHSDSRVWYVPKGEWQDVANTNTEFGKMYAKNVADNLIDPVDLLIVDDLRHATPSSDFSSMHNVANEGQKKLKKWADKLGCLLIGCVGLPRDLQPNELNRTEFETLRVHNILRAVEAKKMPEVEGEPPTYEITIGTQRYGEATQEELDGYAPKTIIQP